MFPENATHACMRMRGILGTLRWKTSVGDLYLTDRHNESVTQQSDANQNNMKALLNTQSLQKVRVCRILYGLVKRSHSTCKLITRAAETLSFDAMIEILSLIDMHIGHLTYCIGYACLNSNAQHLPECSMVLPVKRTMCFFSWNGGDSKHEKNGKHHGFPDDNVKINVVYTRKKMVQNVFFECPEVMFKSYTVGQSHYIQNLWPMSCPVKFKSMASVFMSPR